MKTAKQKRSGLLLAFGLGLASALTAANADAQELSYCCD